MNAKLLALAAGLLLASAGAALASPGRTTADLNLRSGPGTRYGVVDTMPAGARVNIENCSGSWCRVDFQGTTGFAAANLLRGTTYAYRSAPPVVVESSPYVYDDGPDFLPDYSYDDGPDFGLGFGFVGFHHGFHRGFGGFHHGFHGFHGGFHGYHGGFHGGFHGGGFHGGGFHGGHR